VRAELQEFVRAYDVRALNDAPVTPKPLMEHAEDEDEEDLKARLERLSYEVPASDWRAIHCTGTPVAAPRRFIDGSVNARTVAVISVGGQRRPIILACIAALALELVGRDLNRRTAPSIETVVCLANNDLPSTVVPLLESALAPVGIGVIAARTDDSSTDFETLRRRTWDLAKQRMESLERDLLLAEPGIPTLVDGLLERRLKTKESLAMPAIGMVKRQLRQYLPDSHLSLLYDLKPGERTPAFLLATNRASIVSWYLRLSALEGISPSGGLVRLTVAQGYLEGRFHEPAARIVEISALSQFIYGLRHRESSYSRVGVSLEPIVRVEDQMHAMLEPVRGQVARFHRALGIWT
jgi:hypothetical protein